MTPGTGHAERTMRPDPASVWMGLLASPAAPKCAMSALELEGYLTGIIVAPGSIRPSLWMAGLWDDEPVLDDLTQLQSAFDAVALIALAADERLKPAIAPLVGFIEIEHAEFEPAKDIEERLDEAAGNIPLAILLLRKIAQLRAIRTSAAGPTRRTKIGRNDPCPCGSGKKYKRCCN